MLRLVALVISISVLFPWLDPERRGRMRIFFLHWFSGVMYVMSQFVMSVMVLNCWSSKDDSGPFIFFVKFVELAVLNLWSISSLAIAILIASIVQVPIIYLPALCTTFLGPLPMVLATLFADLFYATWIDRSILASLCLSSTQTNPAVGLLRALLPQRSAPLELILHRLDEILHRLNEILHRLDEYR